MRGKILKNKNIMKMHILSVNFWTKTKFDVDSEFEVKKVSIIIIIMLELIRH